MSDSQNTQRLERLPFPPQYPEIIPGTTPKHTFTVPFPADAPQVAKVTYRQAGGAELTKETGTFAAGEKAGTCVFEIVLTQTETLSFSDKVDIWAQINLLFEGGGRAASKPILIECGEQFIREVLSFQGVFA